MTQVESGAAERRQLGWECATTSREIFDFLHERELAERKTGWPMGTRDMSEDERRAAFQRETEARTEAFTKLMQDFETRFSARALFLFDELVKVGALDASERTRFEHPTNTFGLRDIAQKLGVAGERLAPGELKFEEPARAPVTPASLGLDPRDEIKPPRKGPLN